MNLYLLERMGRADYEETEGAVVAAADGLDALNVEVRGKPLGHVARWHVKLIGVAVEGLAHGLVLEDNRGS